MQLLLAHNTIHTGSGIGYEAKRSGTFFKAGPLFTVARAATARRPEGMHTSIL